ncbi:glycosyltransferase [Methylorubrum zatmanii]|nr:tetratricopeptide repeat protein [Methylorubrum zatmanii]ARO56477.1 glycosyltransferase [Methylorubrum zatmanii]
MREHRKSRTIEHAHAADSVERTLAKAIAHRTAGRYDKARRNLQRALDAAPHHAGAHHELGLLTSKADGPGPAVPHFVAALRAEPEQPRYWLALAVTLLVLNRLDEARALMVQFRSRDIADDASRAILKDFADHAFARGQERYSAGDLAAAETLADLVIGLDETHANATHLAGAIAAGKGRNQQAFDLFSIAIYREPDNAGYFSSLGAVLIAMGDYTGAVSALERAVALNPNLAIAHSNLSGVYQRVSHHSAAVTHARRAVALDPGLSNAHNNLGCSLKSLGHLPEALASFDRALATDPTHITAHSNRLFTKLYAEGVPHTDYAADARSFGARFADPLLRRRPFANDRDSDRRLRIGFVSGDLCTHAVARFIEPFLRHLDRTQFATRAYMTQAAEDAVSARLRTLFDGWHNITGLNDDEAADLIEADAIDILVDLSGHSAGHRLLVFARKPAPVQVSYLGHPATTGLRAMDYRLTDHGLDVPGQTESLHTEMLWWLPGVSATYEPPEGVPPARERAPFEDNGFITFGVMNRFEKIGDEALQAWAEILRLLPDAQLFMVVGDVETPEIRAQVENRLSKAGLPIDRVRLHPRTTTGYFQLYHQFDIALDSFPYNGGTTSCDTLAMGVPFIALRGSHAVARVGSSLLATVGLEELAAETPEDYVARTVALARDPEHLRALRSGLREQVFDSPLMDHARFAQEMGEAFRSMWKRWIETHHSA